MFSLIFCSEDINLTKNPDCPTITEQAAKYLNVYFKYIINNVPHYIFWKDKNSVFMGCNDAFATITGLSSPEVISRK